MAIFSKRVPLVYQRTTTECGHACLAMVSAYFGKHVDLGGLRARFGVSSRGLSLNDLMEMASGIGLSCRPLRAELEYLDLSEGPLILHWNLTHYVVFEGAIRGRYRINDPALGRRTVSKAEMSRSFSGVALEMQPGVSFQREKRKASLPLRWFKPTAQGALAAVLSAAGLSVLLQLLTLAGPALIQIGIDAVAQSGDRVLLLTLGAGFAAVAILSASTELLRGFVLARFASVLQFDWVGRLVRHMLTLPTSFFEQRNLGDLTSRFLSVDSLQKLFTASFLEGFIDAATGLLILVLMFGYSPLLGTVALTSTCVLLGFQTFIALQMREVTDREIDAGARWQDTLLETLRTMPTIRVFGGELSQEVWLRNRLADRLNAGLTRERLSTGARAAQRLLLGLEYVLIVTLGINAVLATDMTIGMLVAFLAYKMEFSARLTRLAGLLVDWQMVRLHTDRVADLLLANSDPSVFAAVPKDRVLGGAIKLENLGFRYSPMDPWVFRNLNLEIRQGECVVIVGPSGCGKSTLLKVLLGLLPCVEGAIYVDGEALTPERMAWFRRSCAAVLQDDHLFARSLTGNVAFLDSSPDPERVEQACRLASIHDDIVRFPMGYNTIVGDLGTGLSGGQQQRLMLARALYCNPRVLALDEATSHVDPATERRINLALRELKMTRLVIAHRPEMAALADRVVRMVPHDNASPKLAAEGSI